MHLLFFNDPFQEKRLRYNISNKIGWVSSDLNAINTIDRRWYLLNLRLKELFKLYKVRKKYLLDFVALPLIITFATFTSNPQSPLIKYIITYLTLLFLSLLIYWIVHRDTK